MRTLLNKEVRAWARYHGMDYWKAERFLNVIREVDNFVVSYHNKRAASKAK